MGEKGGGPNLLDNNYYIVKYEDYQIAARATQYKDGFLIHMISKDDIFDCKDNFIYFYEPDRGSDVLIIKNIGTYDEIVEKNSTFFVNLRRWEADHDYSLSKLTEIQILHFSRKYKNIEDIIVKLRQFKDFYNDISLALSIIQ